MVIPRHFTSLIHASAMYCGPQSHWIRSPRATSLPNQPKTWRTPCRIGSGDHFGSRREFLTLGAAASAAAGLGFAAAPANAQDAAVPADLRASSS